MSRIRINTGPKIPNEVQSAIEGVDMSNFEALFKQYNAKVYGRCLQLVHNSVLAEDLAQNVWVELGSMGNRGREKKLAQFRGESAFMTWLYRVTTNVVWMYFRANKIRPLGNLLVPGEDNKKESEDCIQAAERMRQRRVGNFYANELLQVNKLNLYRALAKLPKGYRCHVIKHDVEGLSYTKIAEQLHCAVGTSKSQRHKGKLKLQAMLT